MGLSIDKTIEFYNGLECHTPQAKDARDVAVDTMHKYQLMQADYEARLKADMVAMLDELDLELYEQYDDTDLLKVKYVRQAIQKKINSLKENKDDIRGNKKI